MFEAIRYNFEKNTLSILDQRLLPKDVIYEDILTVEQGWDAIATMKVCVSFACQKTVFSFSFFFLSFFHSLSLSLSLY